MGKNLVEEKLYLESTLEKIEELIEETELKLKAIPRMYSNDPYLCSSLMSQYTNKLEMLKKIKNKPYFARINFKGENEEKVQECYIGKVGIFDENNDPITVDWRAPISSVYYDSNIGPASYKAPEGIINGDLLVKRQYDIEDKKLNGYQDVDTVSNDEMLKPYLGASADNRLKNIVSTIQSEQNEIIREKILKNLIIQGVAGSGKTTVALHRIAYLVYNNRDKIKPEQYLVIGPNKFFVNYISGVLPDLDVNNVSQLTYDEIVKELLNEEFELISDEDKLVHSITNINDLFFERLKVSMSFKNAIDRFLVDFDKTVVPNKDFEIKGYKILPKEKINEIYNSINDDTLNYDILSKKIERCCLIISRYIEDNQEEISSNIRSAFSEKIKNMTPNELIKERKSLEYIQKEIRNKCNQSLKKYFSGGQPKILNLYINFLKKLKNYIQVSEFKIDSSAKQTIENVKRKKIEFEDLASIMYLYYRIYGCSNYSNYKQVAIDEAQDFGEFNFYALKQLLPNSTFSIFGDLAQSIYQYRGINNWEKVVDVVFNNQCEIKNLNKSYRTTTEIMNEANNLTEHIGLNVAEPVIRHGLDVEYTEIGENKIEIILSLIHKYLNKGYASIAIIAKDEKEATLINQKLNNMGINVTNITNSDIKYNGGICTITSYLSKGLEFDGVIITDASENIYNSEKSIDMKLLYVAMTRALHELNVLHSNELTKPLNKTINKTLKKSM